MSQNVKVADVRSFVEMMQANPRLPEDKIPHPRPSLEELVAAKQEAETALGEIKERKNTLTAKLSALSTEIEAAAERITQAESARGALIEKAIFGDVSSADLLKAEMAVGEAKSTETALRAVSEATRKAQQALRDDLENLKIHAKNQAQRYWGRISDDLAVELKTIAEGTVQRLWAASLKSGRAWDYADLLARCLPQPSAEEVANG